MAHDWEGLPSAGLHFSGVYTTWQLEEEMGTLTFVWDLWLSGLCTGIAVLNPGFHPRQKEKSSLSYYHLHFWSPLCEYL